jgi:uncharacterized protein (TIGR02300 family)
MLDKARLGTRYTCFKCGTKFYDLNRPVPSCPECQADQREAPARDIRALLGKGGPVRKYTDAEDDEAETAEAGEEDDELGLLGGVDDEEEEESDVEIEEDEDMMEEVGGGGGGGGGGDEDE